MPHFRNLCCLFNVLCQKCSGKFIILQACLSQLKPFCSSYLRMLAVQFNNFSFAGPNLPASSESLMSEKNFMNSGWQCIVKTGTIVECVINTDINFAKRR